jgi:hypothetical protein
LPPSRPLVVAHRCETMRLSLSARRRRRAL